MCIEQVQVRHINKSAQGGGQAGEGAKNNNDDSFLMKRMS